MKKLAIDGIYQTLQHNRAVTKTFGLWSSRFEQQTWMQVKTKTQAPQATPAEILRQVETPELPR